MSKSKITFISPEETREIQKDWQGYGKSIVSYGLVMPLFICVLAFLDIVL